MIKVLIVHPNRLVCETIAALMKDEREILVTGYANSVPEALSHLDPCNVILCSVRLPNGGALELTQTITDRSLEAKVLIIGSFDDSEESLLQYIEAGAAGYIRQRESAEELVENIYAAYNNQALISPQIAALLISRVTELSDLGVDSGRSSYNTYDLTPREREVLELMAQGWSNRQIAGELVIEIGTVKNHVHNILKKLDLNSRRDVVSYMAAVSSGQ